HRRDRRLSDRDQRHLPHRRPADAAIQRRRCDGSDVGRDRAQEARRLLRRAHNGRGPMTRTTTMGVLAVLALLTAAPATAQDVAPKRPSLEVLERIIETRTPQTRVEAPDHDRITARRIDIVDADGTIRMTLSGATPAPIIDGIQYKRAF